VASWSIAYQQSPWLALERYPAVIYEYSVNAMCDYLSEAIIGLIDLEPLSSRDAVIKLESQRAAIRDLQTNWLRRIDGMLRGRIQAWAQVGYPALATFNARG
jgi:hypothetical protein